jgi:hypothetical protein
MHDTTQDPEDGVNKPLAAIGAAAAGALAMYYLDPELGARRRALLASLVRDGFPDERRVGRGRFARRAALGRMHGDPRSDAELRERVRAALDHMVSHPRALHVSVEDGVVRLSGRVLAAERDGVLEQVQRIPGVRRLVNAVTAHATLAEATRSHDPVPLRSVSG